MNNQPRLLRFKAKEQILFAKRLAMVLRSGVPLSDALAMLDPGRSASARYVFGSIRSDIARGQTLSSALVRFGGMFGLFTISVVEVAEASGTLSENLEYISEELKKNQALKKKVMGALVYPIVIVCATVGISLMLTVYIFPKIIPVFQGFKQELPISTRILIGLSSFLMNDWPVLILGLVLCGVAFLYALRHKRTRIYIDWLVLRAPVFGMLARSYTLSTSMRTLGLLLRADVRVASAVGIVAKSSSNLQYRFAFNSIQARVAEGRALSECMQSNTVLFPSLCTQMIKVGEETGSLVASLQYVSDMYEEEINDLTRNLTTMLEPILMLSMGAVVGFIAISIITPIYGITQQLSR